MSLFSELLDRIRILHWVVKNAHQQNLIINLKFRKCNSYKPYLSFSTMKDEVFYRNKQRLIAGEDAEFCRNVDDFFMICDTYKTLQKDEYMVSIFSPNDSDEHRFIELYKELSRGRKDFSLDYLASMCFHHGLQSAGNEIHNYIQDKLFVDAGAYHGDSANIFLQHYSPHKVYSFDISAKNAENYEKNMQKYGFNKEKYELNLLGVGAENKMISFCDEGTAGCTVYSSGKDIAEIVRLDDFLQDRQQPVGFIKADVEGSGLEMIKGCVDILKKDRPVLSLSIYHNPDEFFGIKPFIEDLRLGYHFEIQHHAPHNIFEDFVLFAYPEELKKPQG